MGTGFGGVDRKIIITSEWFDLKGQMLRRMSEEEGKGGKSSTSETFQISLRVEIFTSCYVKIPQQMLFS